MFLRKINYLFYSLGIQSSVQRQPLSVDSVSNSWQITEGAQLAAGGAYPSVPFVPYGTR